jgi:predicted nucleotidyltransferase
MAIFTYYAINFPVPLKEKMAKMPKPKIYIPDKKIFEFCRRHHVRRLSFFGSVLRDDFQPGSDVDILVEFEPGTRMGMIRLAGLELELGEILGRKVDLNTPGFLSEYYREQVLAQAEVQYEQA